MNGWARSYAELGWRVFPVEHGGKKPLYRGWQREATTDPEQIDHWWHEGWSDDTPNIGVICGEIFDAWDIEKEHLTAFGVHALQYQHDVLLTPIARTGGGGTHILTQPSGVDATRFLYLNGIHIGELKSTGGFIVVCPSITQDQYTWVRAPEKMTLAPAPPYLLALLERPRRTVRRWPATVRSVDAGMRKLSVLGDAVRRAAEGSRNSFLYWAMRRALEEGIPARVAAMVLEDAATGAGLDPREIQATIRSAAEAEGHGHGV
jgi:hypothetical protein